MNIFYSPTGIVDSRHPAQGLTDMSHAGLKHIALDLAMYCSGHDLENYGKPMQPCRPVPRGNNPQCGDCRPKADKGTPGNDTAAKKLQIRIHTPTLPTEFPPSAPRKLC